MFKDFDPTERVRLETVLEELEAVSDRSAFLTRIRYPDPGVVRNYRRWIDNLLVESHLQRVTWRALISAILGLPDNAPEHDVFEASVKVFRSILGPGNSLTGPEARVPEHRRLGRVMPRKTLEAHLRDKLGGSEDAANRFVSDLAKREVAEHPESMLDIALHDHLMWSTFSDDGDPFSGIPAQRPVLCCVLGLMDPGSDEVVQLVYDLPPERIPHIPTIAEAYAGGAWEVLFQPTHSGATVGRTIPRVECADERTRPEVVHRPISLRHLRARIKVI